MEQTITILKILSFFLLYSFLVDLFSRNNVREYFENKLGLMLKNHSTHTLLESFENNKHFTSGAVSAALVIFISSLPMFASSGKIFIIGVSLGIAFLIMKYYLSWHNIGFYNYTLTNNTVNISENI